MAQDISRTGSANGALRIPMAGRFDQVSLGFHWLTVLLVVGQFATAWWLSLGDQNAPLLLIVHRSMGTLTLVVVIGRLVWRHTRAHLPAFPDTMPMIQRRIAQANEFGLYALLLLQPITGLGDTLFRAHDFILFGLDVPPLVAKNKPLFQVLHTVHEYSGWTLLGLIGLHAGAALFHGLVLRDGVLERMLPWTAKDPQQG
jgi:cytochrome b561